MTTDATERHIGRGASVPAAQGFAAQIPVDAFALEVAASAEDCSLQIRGLGDVIDDVQQKGTMEALLRAIERLERTILLETGALERNSLVDLHEYNHMKSHGLLELKRAIDACRALDRATFEEESRAALAGLRTKLERNLVGLRMQLRAVSEIATIIARAIEDHESDGTYTALRMAKAEIK
ncbi:hypothetical protein [Methylocella silvestris]|uniref:FlgN family protein n=1 Tax=Methylocella silvestris TaxID=199596 RepID=A0A2J7TMG4_METSI|nr:hypothetical protein [Methylocella silvestris]PNG27954.1 hypothetical protein CR492_03455 [Methylocella silvestris]